MSILLKQWNAGMSSGINWSSYWATLLSDIGYTHPMLPGLTIDKVGGVWTITSHTIDDFRKTLPSPTVKYVNATSGLDTNNGNTAETAYKTFNKLNSVSYDRAYISAGCYAGTASAIIFGDREIISDGESFVCRGYLGSELSWSDEGGGVFSASLSAFQVMVDTNLIDAANDPTALSIVANRAAVEATAGTCYYDSVGDVLYVRMFDDLTPERDDVLVAIASFAPDKGKYNYMENITVICPGGVSNDTATLGHFTAKGCKFIYKPTTNLINFSGNNYVWLENCIAARARDDAFTYKDAGGYSPSIVEINCVGRDCGGTDNYGLDNHINNGSTTHDGAIILRINGEYYGTEGIQVHDVGQAVSLNIACYAHDSISGDAPHKGAFGTGAGVGDTSKVYLFECKTSGDDTDGVVNLIPATAHIYGRLTDGIHSVQAGTTLEPF